MTFDKKLLALIAVLALAAGAAYKLLLADGGDAGPRKVDGTVYVLPKDFLINLRDGRYAKLSVALVLDEAPKAGEGEAVEGYGALPEEAVVRDVVIDELGGQDGDALTTAAGRAKAKAALARALRKRTDVALSAVLFPDLTVQ
ncbi:flagellar basal body-associated FliL family protein [Patulibacter defluvii]|uniref:flagellar basal body-associated FliL family protein n=1 Tax=Patulibacter defluvii TaxID=3095358 RepID=UPI002A758880|nr:flagellar basal body-associated FliL family protein [Patulibacter sp. DM4]